ncbi:MAG: HEAT repeat domain-containing protein [Pirellulales bacterium]
MRLLFFTLSVLALSASSGCTGPGLFDRQSWLFGKDPLDDPALLARIGPTQSQKIALVHSLREKLRAAPEEAELAAAELAQRIQTETDPAVRIEIVKALGDTRSASATAVLRAGLGYPRPDPDAEVRVAICESWGHIGGDEARSMLASALANDTDGDVRIQAACSLGEFKDSGNMQSLAAALEDSNIAVQHYAMQSMKSVSGQDFGEDAKAWREYARSGAASSQTPSLAARLWPWK